MQMISVMNEYVNNIKLKANDVTKAVLEAALMEDECVEKNSIIIKSNRYIVDIRLKEFTIEKAVKVMNHFMEGSRFHYSAFFVRFNEGSLVRYRYASCREDREGFYCDVMIS
jgi:hypothetical protein